jgi:hypothetical protein
MGIFAMSAPLDTLKLARQFEAAGLDHQRADLRSLEQRLRIWTGSVGALFAGPK